MQPRQPGEIQPGITRYAAVLQREAIGIKNRQLHQVEIKRVADCPDDGGDAGRLQREVGDLLFAESILQHRQLFSCERRGGGFIDVIVDQLD